MLVVTAVNPPSAALESGSVEEQAERRTFGRMSMRRMAVSELSSSDVAGMETRRPMVYIYCQLRDGSNTVIIRAHRIVLRRDSDGWLCWMDVGKRRNEEWWLWWWWSGCQMLGGLSGERQTAEVQHLVLPPTDWQANRLIYNPASNLFLFPWDLL